MRETGKAQIWTRRWRKRGVRALLGRGGVSAPCHCPPPQKCARSCAAARFCETRVRWERLGDSSVSIRVPPPNPFGDFAEARTATEKLVRRRREPEELAREGLAPPRGTADLGRERSPGHVTHALTSICAWRAGGSLLLLPPALPPPLSLSLSGFPFSGVTRGFCFVT